MVGIVDVGLGNTNSVSRALSFLNIQHGLVTSPREVSACSGLILPGVGAFQTAMNKLVKAQIAEEIHKKVTRECRPILGICLGMQLLATHGEEGGLSEGLGLVKGKVRLLNAVKFGLRVPHVGWNDVENHGMSLLDGDRAQDLCMYFVHKYELQLEEDLPVALCSYGSPFIAGFEKDHIMGVQFHPEKSQAAGLKVLSKFAKRCMEV